jgi:hypothetical protein
MSGSPENSPWGEDPLDSSISVPMLSDSLDRAGLRGQVLVRRLAPLVPLTRASETRWLPRSLAGPLTSPSTPAGRPASTKH